MLSSHQTTCTKMSVTEMRTLRWISGKTKNDRVRSESLYGSLGVIPIGDKMKESD